LRTEVDNENGVVEGGGVWVLHGEALARVAGFRKRGVEGTPMQIWRKHAKS
jgi:hypothetical protein